ELCELLESLRRHPGQVLLALGGDILDLLQVAGSPQDPGAPGLECPASRTPRPPGRSATPCAAWSAGPGPTCSTWSATTTRPWPGTPPPASWSQTGSARPPSPRAPGSGAARARA